MSYYTEEDLRDFVSYTKEHFKTLKKEDIDEEGRGKLEGLIRILLSMRYNPMLFETYIQDYSPSDYLLNKDLNQLPLHINDEGLLSQIIVKWRLQRNK